MTHWGNVKPPRWDIFCRVIDNFGDIGVSWRLARQLADEHGVAVRLWVDHLPSLQALCPSVSVQAHDQIVQGVTVYPWLSRAGFATKADVVIEAFGCGLPSDYLAAMAREPAPPLWIVLEYLSAEPWVRSHHGLPSPHPQLNLRRYFFFPGFTQGTGGLLCEADLLPRARAFDARARTAWWRQQGFDDVPAGTLSASLFAYPNAPYVELLNACVQGEQNVVLVIPAGPLAQAVRGHLACGEAPLWQQGKLDVRFVPFVAQADFDALLWACDLNFVRGEDSFVRAQWAGHPFVWHIYPQAENAHHVKLHAFLDLYQPPSAARDWWLTWNGVNGAPPVASAWPAYLRSLPAQRAGLMPWQQQLTQVGGLTANLLNFCQKLL